jgi:hypothetical protein
MSGSEAPLRVYGAKISYYTGKLEGYLRYKEIPYEFVSFSHQALAIPAEARFSVRAVGSRRARARRP